MFSTFEVESNLPDKMLLFRDIFQLVIALTKVNSQAQTGHFYPNSMHPPVDSMISVRYYLLHQSPSLHDSYAHMC